MKLLVLMQEWRKLLQKPSVDIVAITISSPLLIGIYKNQKLIKVIKKEGKTSEILPLIFDEILKNFDVKNIVYTKGPGSYMAIKLSFIFFKTLEITKNIKLLGAEGFEFNNNKPIKAVGNTFFVKKEGIISLEKSKRGGEFFLPEKIDINKFNSDVSPLYVLNPV